MTGIRSPARSVIQGSVGPHVVAATRLLSSNLRENLAYVGREEAVWDGAADDQKASLSKDAAKCMYFGNQLNLLYA